MMTPKEIDECKVLLGQLAHAMATLQECRDVLDAPKSYGNSRALSNMFVRLYQDGRFPSWDIPAAAARTAIAEYCQHCTQQIGQLERALKERGVDLDAAR